MRNLKVATAMAILLMIAVMMALGVFATGQGEQGTNETSGTGTENAPAGGELKFGENTYNWASDQIFWLAVVALIAIMITPIIKKAWIMVGGIALMGGLVLFFIANPTTLSKLAGKIFKEIFKLQ